jgi:hypothetical protein
MNLYRISQKVNIDYDTYDSAVVCAESEEAARSMHPSGREWDGAWERWGDWCAKDDVQVELVGKAEDTIERGVVCASFNAG